MKLVERVLQNISSEDISELASAYNFSSSKMLSVINSVIPGVLSAFKARIVSSMNSGDVTPLLGILSHSHTDLNIENLFDDNEAALQILYQRVSAICDIDINKTPEVVKSTMPTISNAIVTMFQEFNADALMSPENNNYINQLITSDNGYEKAISAANNFLNTVFDKKVVTTKNANENTAPESDNFVQNLYDLFDQDNDGSVMDDIYHMLVR